MLVYSRSLVKSRSVEELCPKLGIALEFLYCAAHGLQIFSHVFPILLLVN